MALVAALVAWTPSSSVRGGDRDEQWAAKLDAFVATLGAEYDRQPWDGMGSILLGHGELRPAGALRLRMRSTIQYGGIPVHHRVEIVAYSFQNEESREKTLSGWLGCFNWTCEQIPEKGSSGWLKDPPMFMVVSPKSIVILIGECATVGDAWNRERREAERAFGEGAYRLLDIQCGGPAVWRDTNEPRTR